MIFISSVTQMHKNIKQINKTLFRCLLSLTFILFLLHMICVNCRRHRGQTLLMCDHSTIHRWQNRCEQLLSLASFLIPSKQMLHSFTFLRFEVDSELSFVIVCTESNSEILFPIKTLVWSQKQWLFDPINR